MFDLGYYWPEDALETFCPWVNQGFRMSLDDLIVLRNIISPPNDLSATLRVRKVILRLSAVELQTYPAKLDDVPLVGQLGSKWQELGLLRKSFYIDIPLCN